MNLWQVCWGCVTVNVTLSVLLIISHQISDTWAVSHRSRSHLLSRLCLRTLHRVRAVQSLRGTGQFSTNADKYCFSMKVTISEKFQTKRSWSRPWRFPTIQLRGGGLCPGFQTCPVLSSRVTQPKVMCLWTWYCINNLINRFCISYFPYSPDSACLERRRSSYNVGAQDALTQNMFLRSEKFTFLKSFFPPFWFCVVFKPESKFQLPTNMPSTILAVFKILWVHRSFMVHEWIKVFQVLMASLISESQYESQGLSLWTASLVFVINLTSLIEGKGHRNEERETTSMNILFSQTFRPDGRRT